MLHYNCRFTSSITQVRDTQNAWAIIHGRGSIIGGDAALCLAWLTKLPPLQLQAEQQIRQLLLVQRGDLHLQLMLFQQDGWEVCLGPLPVPHTIVAQGLCQRELLGLIKFLAASRDAHTTISSGVTYCCEGFMTPPYLRQPCLTPVKAVTV